MEKTGLPGHKLAQLSGQAGFFHTEPPSLQRLSTKLTEFSRISAQLSSAVGTTVEKKMRNQAGKRNDNAGYTQRHISSD